MLEPVLSSIISWARKSPLAFLSTTLTFFTIVASVLMAAQIFTEQRVDLPTFYDARLMALESATAEIATRLGESGTDRPADINLADPTPDAVEDLRQRVADIEDSLKRFREMLLDDPALLVTLPLVKQEVDILQRADVEIHRRVDGLSTSVRDANAATQWLIALFLTLIVGVSGILVTFLKKQD